MLMMSCLGGADMVWNGAVLGSCTPISFSSCVKLVAAMKKISRLNTMSVNGIRLYGSSISAWMSRIRMVFPVSLQGRCRDNFFFGRRVEPVLAGEIAQGVVHLRDEFFDASDEKVIEECDDDRDRESGEC